MLILRILSGVYLVATFIVATYLAGFVEVEILSDMIFIGIVFQIIFSFVLISTNKKSNHSFLEIILLIVIPIIIFLLFRPRLQDDFWIFIGLFNFFTITGGGIVGLLFSPLIAKIKGQSSRSIGKGMNRGAQYLREAKMIDYAAFMFGWLAFGFIFILARSLAIVKSFSMSEKISFAIVFFFCIALVIVRIFQTSLFSLNNKSKNKNTGSKAPL
jgi:hypothetical protein